MDNPKWILYWRLSATSGGLNHGHLFARKLPPPNTVDYKAYSEIVPQSQGGQARQGYDNLSLLWDFLDFSQLKALSDIVEAGLTAGIIYITFDRADGTKLLNDFVDGNGVPWPLEFQPVSNGRGVGVQNVKLTVNNLSVTGDPSTVI